MTIYIVDIRTLKTGLVSWKLPHFVAPCLPTAIRNYELLVEENVSLEFSRI